MWRKATNAVYFASHATYCSTTESADARIVSKVTEAVEATDKTYSLVEQITESYEGRIIDRVGQALYIQIHLHSLEAELSL